MMIYLSGINSSKSGGGIYSSPTNNNTIREKK